MLFFFIFFSSRHAQIRSANNFSRLAIGTQSLKEQHFLLFLDCITRETRAAVLAVVLAERPHQNAGRHYE